MDLINIHQAKTHLSRLVEEASSGKDIIIAKAGKPMAKLVAYTDAPQTPRKPGALKGKIWMSKDFDAVDKEIEKLFYESKIEPNP